MKTNKVCKFCNKIFKTYKSKNQKFCSISCGLKNRFIEQKQQKYEIVICKNCGKKFESYKCFNRKCCNNKCKYKYLVSLLIDNVRPHWFKKGHIPHNKGKIGYKNKGSFKNDHKPFEIKEYKNRYKTGRYKGIFMRSSWEILFAKCLDRNNIKWLYEPKTFKLDIGYYRPDFYLPEIDNYLEIKGFLDKRSKYKIKEFKKKHLLIVLGVNDKKGNNFIKSVNKFIQKIKV